MQKKCIICGKIHEDWPAIAFSSPDNYNGLAASEKQTIASLSADFCEIHYEDQTDRFIRCVLFQEISGQDQPLNYGIWASLSEKSYTDYKEHYRDHHHEAIYFGYIGNTIPCYESTMSIPANVVVSPGDSRPEIIPHKSFDHPFVSDYFDGITLQEAEKRVHDALDRQENNA